MSNLNQQLWACANILRGNMDASEYKDYVLGLVFYKYVSDLQLRSVYEEETGNYEDYPSREEMFKMTMDWYNEDAEGLKEVLDLKHGYFIEPADLFFNLNKSVMKFEFQVADLQRAFVNLTKQGDLFTGLFDAVDLLSTKLGHSNQERNNVISELIKTLDVLDLFGYSGDVLGDSFEYLLHKVAATGRTSDQHYTPSAVSDLLSKIVTLGQEDKMPLHVYDPTMGSGSLMLNIRKYVKHSTMVHYHGTELNTTTFNLSRMNMLIHGVDKGQIHLKNGDTLAEDVGEGNQYSAIVSNPPYSANWSADPNKYLTDPRFEAFGKLAPKSKADFAFLLHCLHYLKDDEKAKMGVVLPHGVLFRGGAEGVIRKNLVEMNVIDTVIGLPADIFYGTQIPTCILVLSKNRTKEDILYIDASEYFEKQGNKNVMRDGDIEKVFEVYKNREDVDKFARVVSLDEVKANDYNLNIPRYVDISEPEPEIDLLNLLEEIESLDEEMSLLNAELLSMVDDFAVTDYSEGIIKAMGRLLK